MKKITLLLFLLIATIASSQVQKLGELSRGKYIDSRIIYETDGKDVFGYLLLYEFDRKSREVYDLEYIILDKNLNRLTSATFTQGVYKNFMVTFDARLSFVKKINNEIFFGIHDYTPSIANLPYGLINHRYRKINLENFSFSKEFIVQNFKTKEKEYKEGDVQYIKEFADNQTLIPTKGDKFLMFPLAVKGTKIISMNDKAKVNSFALLDNKMNIVWKKEINKDKKNKGAYQYFDSDENTIILMKNIIGSNPMFNIEIYDINTGKHISTFSEKTPDYLIYPFQTSFTDDKIIFYTELYETKNKKMNEDKILGYGKLVIDKQTGKEISHNYLLWNNISSQLAMKDKYGSIKKYGKIMPQDFVHLPNGNSLVIMEGYNKKSNSEILDLFTMELSPEMKVKYFNKINKNKTKVKGVKGSGPFLRKYNYFDYAYNQPLGNNNQDYSFFYIDNEPIATNSRMGKRNYSLGIITYVDGEFHYDKLPLYSKKSKILPAKAQNGYIRLMEISDKETEMRIEKINY